MHYKTTLKTVLISILTMAFAVNIHAQVPDTLSYQGYLTDDSGQASEDPVVVQFSLYNVESGGSPLWSEFQNIFPEQGLFSTTFGSAGNPFPAGLFDSPLFLGVKVSVDAEMTPRTPLSSSAFTHKADDSNTVGGKSAFELDQTGAVAALSTALNSTNSNLASLENQVSVVQSDISNTEIDVNVLQADLNTAENDITSVENSLPSKQDRVTGSCPGESSINQILQNGNVICEIDDAGPWSFDGDAFLASGTRVGVGTSAPAATIQIDSAVDTDPFRARVASSTKLRVHAANGSVSVGTSAAGPVDGLYVSGSTGVGTSSPLSKLTATDINWQFNVSNPDTGGANWFLGASANAWAAGGGKLVINNTNNSNGAALVIDSSKRVGIGNTSPTAKLHIAGGTDVSASNTGGYVIFGNTTSSNIAIDNNEIMGRNNGVASSIALQAEGGEVTINSGGSRDNDSLDVRGRVYFDNGGNGGMRITATSSNPTNALFESTQFEEGLLGFSGRPFWRVYSREFYAQSALEYRTYSDRSLKSNIAPLSNALDTIKSLEGVKYRLDKNPMNNKTEALSAEETFVMENQIGFIAQDVEKVLPQLVTQDDETGLKTVAYMGVIPVLVEALKEQQSQLEAQRAEIDELKKLLK
ncbi:MAG: tail fiber domain-containing protein [Gammaproteobacteria bacterium]